MLGVVVRATGAFSPVADAFTSSMVIATQIIIGIGPQKYDKNCKRSIEMKATEPAQSARCA